MKTIIVKLPIRPICIKWYNLVLDIYIYIHSMYPKVMTLVLGEGVRMTEMNNIH